MTLYINGEQIDFSLENESNLAQILDSLSELAQKEGYYIDEVEVDGEKLKESLMEKAPDEIETLSLEMYLSQEKYLELLEQGESLLKAVLESEASVSGEECERLKDILNKTFTQEEFSLYQREFEPLLKSPLESDSLKRGVEKYRALFQEKIGEEREPEKEALKTANKLKECSEGLSQVSIFYQTGKEKEAADSISTFTALYQKLLRLIPRLPYSESLEVLLLELNPFFKEIIEAFERGDTVTAGDLIEYEISQKLESIQQAVKNSIKDSH